MGIRNESNRVVYIVYALANNRADEAAAFEAVAMNFKDRHGLLNFAFDCWAKINNFHFCLGLMARRVRACVHL